MQRPVNPSFGRVKTVVYGYKYGWTDEKIKEQKKASIDIVRFASKVSVDGATCVFVVNFRSSDTLKFANWLNKRSPKHM